MICTVYEIIHKIGILSALENCQIKIQELEKEKSESKIQIKSLEQELSSARQLLFLKAGNSGSGSGDLASPEPLYKSQSLQRLQKLKSNWIQDARNEVEDLRRKVEMEKQRQSKRQSKEFLFDDGANDDKQNDERGREMNKLYMYNRENENSFNQGSSLNKNDSKQNVDKIQPPVRAHVRSPSYSPVRSGLEDAEQMMDSDFGFLKKDQIGQLKDEIYSTRKNTTGAKSKDKSVKYEVCISRAKRELFIIDFRKKKKNNSSKARVIIDFRKKKKKKENRKKRKKKENRK